MDRREFLRLTALGLLVPACVPSLEAPAPTCVDVPDSPDDGAVRISFAADDIDVDDVAFPQGVSAGSMSATACTFWGRVAGDRSQASLRLRVWRDVEGDNNEVDLVHDVEITLASDTSEEALEVSGIAKRRLDGLAPGTRYRYGLFAVDGADVDGEPSFVARSPIGSVRTALAADSCSAVVLGGTTCTNPRNAPFGALQQLAETDPDLGDLDALLHVGDLVYADGSRTPDAYRAHWRAALADPGYRALLQKTGMYLSWDDHEFDNNINPEDVPAARIDVAKAAFFENTPMETGPDGFWTSYQWGSAVEVIQLDARTERKPSTRADDADAYLSRPQMDFLKDRLKNSPCHFKVVMNSVPMTKMPDLWILQGDRWQGYEPAREEILNFLEENDIDNVWFISGDFHVGFVGRLEQEGFRSRLWEIAVGPGGNLGNPIMAFVLGGEREQVFPVKQFVYGEGRLAATRMRFDPGSDSVRIKYTGTDGEVLFDESLSRKT